MWGEAASSGFLDELTRFSPLITILSPLLAYFLGRNVRAHVNDAELVRVVEAVKELGNSDKKLLDQAQINQNNIIELAQTIKAVDQKVTATNRDVREIRRIADVQSKEIGRIQGNLERGK